MGLVTWTKLGDDYPDRMEYLSDTAFRLHTEMLCVVNKRETGPFLTGSQVMRKTAVRGDLDAAIVELRDCGFWFEADGGYVIHEHMEHQIEPEILQIRRKKAAERQAKHRRKSAGLEEEAS